MSKRAFSITMSIAFVLALTVIVLGACAVKKSEQEVAEVDTYLSEATESTRTSETTTVEEVTTETTTTAPEPTQESAEETTTVSVEELVEVVLNNGINGEERKAYLGDRYDEVQKWLEDNYEPPTPEYYEDYYIPSGDVLTADMGVHDYYGVTETYYNMDMSGVVDWMHQLGYDYDYWVRSDGVKMFGNYVMVAADYGWMPKGSIVETSLGTGIVCDTGLGGWYWFDIATNW